MKRYNFKYNIHDNKEIMEEDPNGEWVKYEDAEQYALEEYQTGVNNGADQCLGLG